LLIADDPLGSQSGDWLWDDEYGYFDGLGGGQRT